MADALGARRRLGIAIVSARRVAAGAGASLVIGVPELAVIAGVGAPAFGRT